MNRLEARFQGALVCRGYARTWAFPAEVARLIEEQTAGLRVLHLFGGCAAFGLRLDMDRAVRPTVVGNAFWPPFRCETFDVVVCDPPYEGYRPSAGMWAQSLAPAACLARRRVWWFSADSLPSFHGLKLRRWWAAMPSEHGPLRYLVEYDRTRHPHGTCHPVPFHHRRKLAVPFRPYDWRSRIEQPNLDLGGA